MMLEEKRVEHDMSKPQAVKLQKYTIATFKGDCKDWVGFWNQFVVEVDSSKISEISNVQLFVRQNCILDQPHTAEGYLGAKKTLEMATRLKLRISRLRQTLQVSAESKTFMTFMANCLEMVGTLVTMKKLQGAQS